MSTKDFLEKDYYKVLGVAKGASRRRDQEVVPQARPQVPPGRQQGRPEGRGALQGDLRGLQRPVRREAAQGVRRGALAVRRRRRPDARLGRRAAATTSTSATCSAAAPAAERTGGRLGDLLGGVFGGGAHDHASSQAAARRGRRDRDVAELRRRHRRRDGVAAAWPARARARHAWAPVPRPAPCPRVCPTCEGTGQGSRNLGNFAFSEPCKTCRGRGLVVDDPCPVCSGSGRAMSTRTIQARIPAGVADGQRIKLKGKGAPGERGGPPGDLYVRVHVEPHPVFGRSGAQPDHHRAGDVRRGCTRRRDQGAARTAACRSACGSRPGTPNGRTFRVRGKGVRRQDGTSGDLLVTVNVRVPTGRQRQGTGGAGDVP